MVPIIMTIVVSVARWSYSFRELARVKATIHSSEVKCIINSSTSHSTIMVPGTIIIAVIIVVMDVVVRVKFKSCWINSVGSISSAWTMNKTIMHEGTIIDYRSLDFIENFMLDHW